MSLWLDINAIKAYLCASREIRCKSSSFACPAAPVQQRDDVCVLDRKFDFRQLALCDLSQHDSKRRLSP